MSRIDASGKGMMTSTLVADEFQTLFRSAQASEYEAVQIVVDEFSGPLEIFLRRRGVADAESTANIVLDRAIRGGDRDRISSRRTFRAYLYAIARNEVVNEQRYVARRVSVDLVADPASVGPWVDNASPSAEVEVLSSLGVDELLACVSEDQAEVLELRLIEGQSLEATAAILGKTLPAVTSLQHRGMKRLRSAVAATIALALVFVGVRMVDREDMNAPVISEETGVVETMPDPDRSESSTELPVLDIIGPFPLGGGTSDAPDFGVVRDVRPSLIITPAEELSTLEIPPLAPASVVEDVEAATPPAVVAPAEPGIDQPEGNAPEVVSIEPLVETAEQPPVQVGPDRDVDPVVVPEAGVPQRPDANDGADAPDLAAPAGEAEAEADDNGDDDGGAGEPNGGALPLVVVGANGADGAPGQDADGEDGNDGEDGDDAEDVDGEDDDDGEGGGGADENALGPLGLLIAAALDQVEAAAAAREAACENLALECQPAPAAQGLDVLNQLFPFG